MIGNWRVVRFFNSAFFASRRWRIFKHFRIVSMIFSSSVVFVILNGSGDVADTQSIRNVACNINDRITRQDFFHLNCFACRSAFRAPSISHNEGRMANGAVNHRSAVALDATCWNPHDSPVNALSSAYLRRATVKSSLATCFPALW
jgi:hypothetical protein